MTDKAASAYKTISEVSKVIGVPAHVLRFWENKFTQLRPMKRSGGRRYYSIEDITLLKQIKTLLYDEGYTIKGAKNTLSVSSKKDSLFRDDLSVSPSLSTHNTTLTHVTHLLHKAESQLERLLKNLS